MNSALFPIHVRTSTGLEDILFKELSNLGLRDLQVKHRLVTGVGTQKLLYKINLWSRTAIRVLKPLASFPAENEKSFYDQIKAIDWNPWISPTGTLAIDAHVHSSFTTHSLFLAQLTKDAICDQFREKTGKRPSVDLECPDLRLAVNLYKNHVEVSLDSSGESLHKRGYKKKTGEAPLSETLAAAIVSLSGWDRVTPLVDPMTGSGTLAIEAGLILTHTAPGLFRKRFGFQSWKDYDAALFETLLEEAKKAVLPTEKPLITAFDKDMRMVSIAKENIERAGLTQTISVFQTDFFAFTAIPKPAGTLLMNPPYDERMEVRDIALLYSSIGERLKTYYPNWNAFILTSNIDAARDFGLRAARKTAVNNGPLECILLEYHLEPKNEQPLLAESSIEENPAWKQKAETFGNRLKKNFKHLSKWAHRENISCWRVYDKDIPEFPFIVDIFEDTLHFAEVPKNHDHSPLEHERYLHLMKDTAATSLGFSPEKTVLKIRQSQKLPKEASLPAMEVSEAGNRFLVNLVDYVDVGLFLEYRKVRKWLQEEAKGKDFLNLFGFTGTGSVSAAKGGAKATVTVDASITYLSWAEQNLRANGLVHSRNELVRSDVLDFLKTSPQSFDLCWVDPPVRFVNRNSALDFNIQEGHVDLLRLVFKRMRRKGRVLFTTNCRGFELAEKELTQDGVTCQEITHRLIPTDFERATPFRAWLFQLTT